MSRLLPIALCLALQANMAHAVLCAPEIPASGGGIGGTGHEEAGGIGGTGRAPGSGGMGGTGLAPEPGTGGVGGTGVIGSITGFASLCVNGLEVHYGAKTPVDLNGEPATLGLLKRGQIVTLQAAGANGWLATPRISVQYALVGPVTQAGSAGLRVMNQEVRMAPGQERLQAELKPGDVVRVSGHRGADGRVNATDISRAAPDTPASMTGRVSADQGWHMGGTPLTGSIPSDVAGRELLVRGRWADGKLVAEAIRPSGAESVLQHSERVVMEAIVHRVEHDGRLTTDQRPVVRDAGSPRAEVGDRIIVTGRIDREGQVRAERIELMHDRPEPISRGGSPSVTSAYSNDGEGRHREADHGGSSGSSERSGRGDGHDKREHLDKAEKSERTEKIERSERAERTEKVEKPEKVEKVEKVEKPEKVERPEKTEKIERPEKVERSDRAERPDRVERNERD